MEPTDIDFDDGLTSALRHFPEQAAKVKYIAKRDEDFRTMCGDLSCVELAVLSVGQLPSEVREERRRELIELANDLVTEIGRALSGSKIVPFRSRSTRQ